MAVRNHEAGGLPAARRVLRDEPPNLEAGRDAFRAFITPAGERFVRSNFAVPASPADRGLFIEGAIERARAFDLEELRALGSRTVVVTTECAGNGRALLSREAPGEPWGLGAISTAEWTGVPLRAVLEAVGLGPRVVELAFAGRDRGELPDVPGVVRFERSLPLQKALEPDTLLAWEMNGAPLPALFGGPLRLVVPGWYGMASVKWLSRIAALESPFEGPFQTERYQYLPGAPVREMRVKSMLVQPGPGERLPRMPCVLRGFAWGGSGGVAAVEVFADQAWRAAQLVGPSHPWAWRAFELHWTPARPGLQTLRVRARDAQGNQQPEESEWTPRGYGANGIQSVEVDVL